MGAQEWPAGQVASVTITSNVGETRTYGRAFWDAFSKEWVDAEAGRFASSPPFWTVTDVRPLVVLDLEGFTEQWLGSSVVQRLRKLAETGNTDGLANTRLIINAIADQIEEQTRPPKPAEPTGLGAVVVDREGVVWQLADDMKGAANWRRAPERNAERTWRFYADIDVERVAFEGVQP